MAKTLYHSELVKLGAVTVTIKSDVQKSKFKDKGEFVTLIVGDAERNYTIENPRCAQFLRDHKGKTLEIVATGSRDEAELALGNGAPRTEAPRQQAPSNQSAPSTSAPPSTVNEAKLVKAKRRFIQYANLMDIAINVTNTIAKTHSWDPKSEEGKRQIEGVRGCLFIQATRENLHNEMPEKYLAQVGKS